MGMGPSVLVAAIRIGMALHLHPADHAMAVQAQVVPPQLAHVVALLVGEVALHHELAREVVIALELRQLAIEAGLGDGLVAVTHGASP